MHDKTQDLYKNKEEIKGLLENEIASRYYYQNGRIEAEFDDDNAILEAINALSDIVAYKAKLSK